MVGDIMDGWIIKQKVNFQPWHIVGLELIYLHSGGRFYSVPFGNQDNYLSSSNLLMELRVGQPGETSVHFFQRSYQSSEWAKFVIASKNIQCWVWMGACLPLSNFSGSFSLFWFPDQVKLIDYWVWAQGLSCLTPIGTKQQFAVRVSIEKIKTCPQELCFKV